MKRVIFSVLVISLGLLLKSCDTNEPPPPPPPNGTTVFNTINLAVEWTDLHRINLKWNISIKDTLKSYRYELNRKDEIGGEVTKNFFISGSDTSYIDGEVDSLASGKEFSYKVRAYDSSENLIDTSKTTITQTLAPTSHNITWTIDTLGQAGNFLNDVWGIDENNVYAVGYVSLNGNNSNVIKWNGLNWIPFSLVEGVLQGIYGFDENNIVVVGTYGSYGYSAIWNGSNWNETNFFRYFPNGDTVWALRSVWGSSPEDVWAVGDFGTIIHWDGTEWKKLQISNEYNQFRFTDVWGFGEDEVYITGRIYQDEVVLLRYNGNDIETIIRKPSYAAFSTIWGPYSGILYLIEYLSYVIIDGNLTGFILPGRQSALEKIRGSGTNNIFIVGHFGETFHFNGLEWKRIDELDSYPNSRALSGCYVTENKVFIIGETTAGAIFIKGEL